MQNQYAILAERIKHTESQLAEAKARLETVVEEREQALLMLKEMESKSASEFDAAEFSSWKNSFVGEIKALLNSQNANTEDATSATSKEQFNFLRQSLKEFKIELSQKFSVSTNQYHELSNQLWQLIELNKKLTLEAEQLGRLIQNTETGSDDTKQAERPFTLASIKKRS